MRVYELAREIDVESKELVARALDLGIEVKTASSGLSDDDAEILKLSYAEERGETEVAAAEPVAEAPEAETASEPETEAAATAAVPDPEVAEASDTEGYRRRTVTVTEGITVQEFAEITRRPVGIVVRELISRGQMAGATQPIPVELLSVVGEALGYQVEVEAAEPDEQVEAPLVRAKRLFDDDPADLVLRPAVVTVMGHVDHGKTQLLDSIRHANVVASEAGGITQHIGAYQAKVGDRMITFIDTPGHEAFTTLRARGAEVTDIVVLVVAADDGVMPQTVEAISHAKAANVPIVIAINKIDLDAADPNSVRAQLTEHGLVVEALGGDVVSAEVSALTGEGVDQLLEYIDLIAELEEFSANPSVAATGTVIEAQLDKGRGPVATVLIQSGTLRVGDPFVTGVHGGRVRALFNEDMIRMKEAGPSVPVQVLGLSGVPQAGDSFAVIASEREAREITQRRQQLKREQDFRRSRVVTLGDLQYQIQQGKIKELNVVVKGDVDGSVEAVNQELGGITHEEVRIAIVHSAVGSVSESDVLLASASNAIVIAFRVTTDSAVRALAVQSGVDIRQYEVIYEVVDELRSALSGLLAPEVQERLVGSLEVREVFSSSRAGTIAGCFVQKG
ncbi:MAG: translation initiation factor IF-2, partial [Acidobacteria bacterium]|nr:translation initiation factor IF-2 [Acidobacteriota bacterium]